MFAILLLLLGLLARRTSSRLEDFDHFPSFGEMEDYLYQVAQNHSDLVKVSVEGLTEEGRPIYLLKIGGGGDNEDPLTSASTATIFIDAGIHAREWIAPMTAFYLIESLVEANLRKDPRVTTHPVYYIMPILNPDGYEFSRTPGHRLWRKNRSSPPPGSDCYGIDLNRNYDVVGFGIGASSYPCAENYMGEEAATQPEVIAASNVVLRVKPQVSISLHSYGQKWLTSWGYTTRPATDNDKLIDLGKRAAKAMKAVHGREYDVETAAGFYPAGGASDDFAKARARVPYAVTLELPPDKVSFNDGFEISASLIRSVGEEVWAGLVPVASAAIDEAVRGNGGGDVAAAAAASPTT